MQARQKVGYIEEIHSKLDYFRAIVHIIILGKMQVRQVGKSKK